MANPPKAKGTGFEREIKNRLEAAGFRVRRTPASARFDLEVEGHPIMEEVEPLHALITRPDHGRALVTVSLEDFMGMLFHSGFYAWLECKRYKKMAHHTLFETEVG